MGCLDGEAGSLSPCSPARARCGRPRGPRSSAPACCWRWWPAQTRWWGQRTALGEEGGGGGAQDPAWTPQWRGGGSPGKERGCSPQTANYPATVMLLAPEHHTCCFWREVNPCDPRSDSRQDEPALPASAAAGGAGGVGGGAWWEGSHHLKGVRKKPQGIRHVRMGEGCLQAGSTYSVGVPLPGPCERLLVFLECSES